MQKFAETLAYKTSRGALAVASGAQLSVFEGGSDTLATLYADDETAELSNPITADDSGLVQFKLANGTYDFVYHNNFGDVRIDGMIADDGSGGGGGDAPNEATGTTVTVISCNTPLPIDDSKPQSNEGTEVVTVTFTPDHASSAVELGYVASGSTSAGMFIGAAVFVDSDVDALVGSTCMEQTTGANQKFQIGWTFKVAAGSTATRTYKLRIGPQQSGTAYVNGDSSGARLLGGAQVARITAREVTV